MIYAIIGFIVGIFVYRSKKDKVDSFLDKYLK
jgi:hypothetical protein